MRAKDTDAVAQERTRAEVTGEGDEVSGGGIDVFEHGRVLLAARLVAVEAEALQVDHGHHFLAAVVAAPGVDVASHLVGLEVRRLFVGEGNKADRPPRLFVREGTGQREQRRHTAAVVVCSR